jgi:spermidine synthase / saccharopine dehydrogenase (NADP+, L-glutamate-forming)
MSELLSDKRVTVFVGDGFKFLADNTSSYDVIITDSSDPVGPAQALFEKPYFQLLHDALNPGGQISTQGECLWLHLPLIRELNQFNKTIFPVATYAFTTIPTYPSGQIGFVLCSKEKGRDLSKPLRKVKGTRYYNEEVHKAAFVLPEFARAMLQEGKDLRPQFGKAAESKKAKDGKRRRILLLGSGFVAKPCAEYVVRDPLNDLTIGRTNCALPWNSLIYHYSLSYSRKGTGARSRSAEHQRHLSRCNQLYRT